MWRLCRSVASFCTKAEGLVPGVLLQAPAGNGIVTGHASGVRTAAEAAGLLKVLAEEAARAQGNVMVLRCSPAWKAELPVWGLARGDLALMRAVKEKLDPRGLFNPGRFVGGGTFGRLPGRIISGGK